MNFLPFFVFPICFGIISYSTFSNHVRICHTNPKKEGCFGFTFAAIIAGFIFALFISLQEESDMLTVGGSLFLGALIIHCLRCFIGKNEAKTMDIHWNDKEIIIGSLFFVTLDLILLILSHYSNQIILKTVIRGILWSFIIVFPCHVYLGILIRVAHLSKVMEQLEFELLIFYLVFFMFFYLIYTYLYNILYTLRHDTFAAGFKRFFTQLFMIILSPLESDYYTNRYFCGIRNCFSFPLAALFGFLVGIIYATTSNTITFKG